MEDVREGVLTKIEGITVAVALLRYPRDPRPCREDVREDELTYPDVPRPWTVEGMFVPVTLLKYPADPKPWIEDTKKDACTVLR